MAHLAWAAATGPPPPPFLPPAFDNRSSMSIPGARRNSTSWSECSTLVDLPAVSSEPAVPPARTNARQISASSVFVATAASGLVAADWGPGPWQPSSPTADDIRRLDGERKRRTRMALAWQKIRTRLMGAKNGDGELAPSAPRPLDARPPIREQLPIASTPAAAAANPNRRTMDFRTGRSGSFAGSSTGSSNSARHSWHSSSSSSSHSPTSPATVEMVWSSMAAGFIM